MEKLNQSDFHISYFTITGLSGLEDWASRMSLFTLLLLLYSTVLAENNLFLMVIIQDELLHSPMYLFIGNLALIDLCLPSVIIPQIMHQLLWNDKTINFTSCVFQMGLYICLNMTECFIFTAMAYDRYQAICNPLHYPIIMTNRKSAKLGVFCWIPAIVIGFAHIWTVMTLNFCGPNDIFSYYCEHISIIKLSCSDVNIYSVFTLALAMIVICSSMCFIFLTYLKILITVNKVASSEGSQKAFSTCVTHLIIIAVFLFGAGGVLLSSFITDNSVNVAVILGIFQNTFPPLINPIIYCLKTKEIRISLLKAIRKNVFHN
ncbi:olfactory receptor 2A12-like [Protopterus annectens]|uniref:olfactory receptor 2A12-like n=1 Tax=Protopterus annectens TaxID=7888 RepID=UPI001CF99CF4|nr:olfactory receptor 2A12-like [Protopterus annectens]